HNEQNRHAASRTSFRVATLLIAGRLAAMRGDATPSPDDGLPAGWRERVVAWAAGKERIHEVHFFGSRAKGKQQPESDVDLAYLLTGDEPGDRLAFSICECGGWGAEVAALLGVPVDLQFTDNVDDLAVWAWVREHGQLIYRKPGYPPVE